MSTTCGHERVAFLSHAVRPVPDAWYPCPDCGEYVGLRNGRAITIRENNELARGFVQLTGEEAAALARYIEAHGIQYGPDDGLIQSVLAKASGKGRKKAMSDDFATQPGSDEPAERLLVCDKCAAIWSWDRDDSDPFTSYEYEIGTEHAGCGGRKRVPGDDRLNADDLAGQRRFIWQQKNEIRARAGQMMAHWEDECWPLMVEDADAIRAAAQKLRCLAQWRGAAHPHESDTRA